MGPETKQGDNHENEGSAQFNKLDRRYASFVTIDPIRNYLHYPEVIRRLGDVRGKRVLDVGCGDGLFDRILAEECGAEVSAYDKAPDLIAIASQEEVRGKLGIRYEISAPETFEAKDRFDRAVSVMVLPYAPTAEYLSVFFRSTHKALKPGGQFISVVFNPGFELFGELVANRVFKKLDGARVEVQFIEPQSGKIQFTAVLNQFSKSVYERAARRGGFENASWNNLAPNALGKSKFPDAFWSKAESGQPYAILIAGKNGS